MHDTDKETVKSLNCIFYIHTYFWFAVDEMPYLYKFSRDVYFADATNSAFSRFYFLGSQDFVLVDYVCTIININFRGPHVIHENNEIYVPRKFVQVQ